VPRDALRRHDTIRARHAQRGERNSGGEDL
jgi:hypothetical protein